LNLLNHYCPNLQPIPTPNGLHGGSPPTGVAHPAACRALVHGLDLHATLRYQPASHFWLLQSVESALFLALSAALIGIAILAVTRHRQT